jgi:hypothetical protein
MRLVGILCNGGEDSSVLARTTVPLWRLVPTVKLMVCGKFTPQRPACDLRPINLDMKSAR